MASDKKESSANYSILVLNSVYKDPESIFSFQPKPIDATKDSALIILDTNVLLLPYKTGKESLKEIRKVYASLIKQGRLVVPGQVAREFAKNRTDKLKEVHQQLSRKRISIPETQYPLLEDSERYKAVRKLEDDLRSKLREYVQAVDGLLDELKTWNWNDPVSKLYHELFKSGVVFEPPVTSDKDIALELERRQTHGLPPGYKDQAKPDEGVGDLLIWNAILEVGRSRDKDAIFVSADRKADWWARSEGSPLYPRFELIEEYRRETNGRSIHIIDLATLLSMFGATKEAVTEVQSEEIANTIEQSSIQESITQRRTAAVTRPKAFRLVRQWLEGRFPAGIIESFHSDFGSGFIIDHAKDNETVVLIRNIDDIISWPKMRKVAISARNIRSIFKKLMLVLVFPSAAAIKLNSETIAALRATHPDLEIMVGAVWNGDEFLPFPDH